MIEIIVSGGQTGVDRSALDAAIQLSIVHTGWCPKGRKSENGVIPEIYQLNETESEKYEERTQLNVRDSEGTLIFVPSTPIKVTDGTVLTMREVFEKNQPHLIIDLSQNQNINSQLKDWVNEKKISVLNIAGPRESQSPGIYKTVFKILTDALQCVNLEDSKSEVKASGPIIPTKD